MSFSVKPSYNLSSAFLFITIFTQPAFSAPPVIETPVIWTDGILVSIDGNSLTKTKGFVYKKVKRRTVK